jgi:hypothetical protein
LPRGVVAKTLRLVIVAIAEGAIGISAAIDGISNVGTSIHNLAAIVALSFLVVGKTGCRIRLGAASGCSARKGGCTGTKSEWSTVAEAPYTSCDCPQC